VRYLTRSWLRFCAAVIGLSLYGCDSSVTVFNEDEIPAQLSEWKLHELNSDRLTVSNQVTPYSLNVPLFTDYAHKLRTLYLPQNTQINADDGQFTFPVGTVITKTFYYPRGEQPSEVLKTSRDYLINGESLDLNEVRLIETRLLVKYSRGWQAYPYIWNDDQTNATLEVAGDVFQFELVTDQGSIPFNYVVPDANQCSSCHAPNHTSAAIMPIGPKPANLDGEFLYGEIKKNQLKHWFDYNLLTALPSPAMAFTTDERATADSLDRRARSYLDANCAHCHNSNGAADTSGLLLNIEENDMRALGLCKPPVAAGRGAGSRPYSIYAGHPEKSIMLYRMQSRDPGEMMPEIGRSLVDEEGVQLIAQWIAEMASSCDS